MHRYEGVTRRRRDGGGSERLRAAHAKPKPSRRSLQDLGMTAIPLDEFITLATETICCVDVQEKEDVAQTRSDIRV